MSMPAENNHRQPKDSPRWGSKAKRPKQRRKPEPEALPPLPGAYRKEIIERITQRLETVPDFELCLLYASLVYGEAKRP